MQRSKLEITLISAHDLPPIARNLNTYGVAWLKPDHKYTTLIDYNGHTNPKWDQKFSFYLEDNYQQDETITTLTVEIYNVGWFSDILIGSAQVLVTNLVEKGSLNHRPFVVLLCRPTGIQEGNVSLGVNLIDRSNNTTVRRNIDSPREIPIEKIRFVEEVKSNNEDVIYERSRSERTAKFEDFPIPVDLYHGGYYNGEQAVMRRTKSGCSMTDVESLNSLMRPLPTEVAAALKDGLHSTCGDDVGRYNIPNRRVEVEPRGDKKNLKAMVTKWQQKAMLDETPVVDSPRSRSSEPRSHRSSEYHHRGSSEHHYSLRSSEHNHLRSSEHSRQLRSSSEHQRRKNERRGGGGGGLFSCLVLGKEFSFICGGNNDATKRRRNEKAKGSNHRSNPREKCRF